MMMRASVLVVALVAMAATSAAEPAPAGPWHVTALYHEGASISWQPRVQNNSAPIVEGRLGYRLRPWLIPDLGLALNAFPEQVLELRPGARVHPASHIPYMRVLFVRLAVHALVSIDGFDVAPDLEVGAAIGSGPIYAYLAGHAGVYVIDPRVVLGGRVGFGVRF